MMSSPDSVVEASSFRDPSGFVFYRGEEVYRQINRRHEADYTHLIKSGLYAALVESKLLIPHEEVAVAPPHRNDCFKIIKPERILFVSYPYEWCFSQLKDAALVTLRIQKRALDFGMSLRDCSAYNIQFRHGRPLLIDTLSFAIYREGEPWIAYKQFCQHFLAPLMLMSRRDIRLNQLCVTELDGIPLNLARTLLSYHAWLSWAAFLHIYLHGRFADYYSGRSLDKQSAGGKKFSGRAFRGLIDSLENAVTKFTIKPSRSHWLAYTTEGHNYSDDSLNHKLEIVTAYLRRCDPKEVWDLGANTGVFSRVASACGARVIAFDQDPYCVEANYLQSQKDDSDILPLVLNVCNPTPAIGWKNHERRSLLQRAGADTVLALALIHHLAIANNVPLANLANFFAAICRWLIIEFVPKADPKVQLLLSHREDIFPNYTLDAFEYEFGQLFSVEQRTDIRSSERILFLLRRLDS